MATQVDAQRDAFVERLSGAALGAYELLTVHLGDRLGYYRALADAGELTSAGLAEATGTDERYAREWLEQQAVAGILEVDDAAADAAERRYGLPAGHVEVLVDRESLSHLTPMARYGVSFAQTLPAVEEAFRTGGGVPWDAYGQLARDSQADSNRPLYANLLGSEWLPAIADVHERLLADPPACVADVACGSGWSSIAIARAYPKVRVDGLDIDPESVALALANLGATEVADRVTFQARDAGDPELAGSYQLVTVFEALHDMSQPVEVLRALHGLVAEDGAVVVMDERVADRFTAPGDEIERIMYAYSVLCCLPVGRADTPSAATGTVMRTDTLRRYATEAGFAEVEVLPIEHETFRFYRLHL
ncbi:MAG TPA: methyltransferase domain-containing protein [Gaiellaceae bacterium]|jgi:2-polyprenyl-3-methyl-5-hydroxy-6-metoxy-1,4-benzoquinol methylase|nr:methyltransferase domain-containing protein [Gaiellaceae bacterium]